jgi:hypothetical protein
MCACRRGSCVKVGGCEVRGVRMVRCGMRRASCGLARQEKVRWLVGGLSARITLGAFISLTYVVRRGLRRCESSLHMFTDALSAMTQQRTAARASAIHGRGLNPTIASTSNTTHLPGVCNVCVSIGCRFRYGNEDILGIHELESCAVRHL